jgi:hypothetical protein
MQRMIERALWVPWIDRGTDDHEVRRRRQQRWFSFDGTCGEELVVDVVRILDDPGRSFDGEHLGIRQARLTGLVMQFAR